MAVEVPSFDELMWPTLQALKAMGGSASNEELLQKIIELGGYPTEVQNLLHSDGRQTRLNYSLGWAKTYLKFSGALDNSQRGVWSITELGEALTEADVAAIPGQVRKKATRDGAPAIDLIDGELLCTLLKDLKLGVATEMVEKANVDGDWFKRI